MDQGQLLKCIIVLAVIYLVYREFRRQAMVSAVTRAVRGARDAVADVANSFVKAIPGTNYRGGQRYGQRITGWGQADKYAKVCDPACEDTPQGCVKHNVDPLTGRVEMVPCDPGCCKCKGCREYSDPSTGNIMCAKGMPDNTIQPCEAQCCFHKN